MEIDYRRIGRHLRAAREHMLSNILMESIKILME